MTPAARIAAAAEVLDRIAAGVAAEQALTNWARSARYAGSGDRAGLRDLVFDALRRRRSLAALGGAETGRGLMLGRLREAGDDPDAMFSGVGHAPAPLTAAERAAGRTPPPGSAEALDCPDWLWPQLSASLGAETGKVLEALRHRAPVHLRVNLRRCGREVARAALAAEGIGTVLHTLSPTALEVTGGARRIRRAAAYLDGTVELQDAASQAVADAVPVPQGGRVLDYCAGGGGKTLALAARAEALFFAHDVAPRRMADLPARAARAGVEVTLLATDLLAQQVPFDTVLVDAPCSGSGSWRRDPEAKWRLDADRLAALVALQAEILDSAAALVRRGGTLVYATCSLLPQENDAQIDRFLDRHSGWRDSSRRSLTPCDGGDGFFTAVLARDPT
jgi:16S rRNA (cytosine967-C5)-methyltransferase